MDSGDTGDDRPTGGAAEDRLTDGGANDRLTDGGANDRLTDGGANDRPTGGNGEDRLTDFESAREVLQSHCRPHGRTETIQIDDSAGRRVASASTAVWPVPQFDRIDADGIAVRASDTFDASGRSPVRLTETEPPLERGEAMPVRSGEKRPSGADAVVPARHVTRRNGRLIVFDAVPEGAHITSTGDDVQAGSNIVDAGERLSPVDCALLRAAGRETVTVSEPPHVTVFPAGDGLVTGDPGSGEAVETNGQLLETLVTDWGGTVARFPPVRIGDGLQEQLRTAADPDDTDLLVTTGGTSRNAVASTNQSAGGESVPAIVREIGTVDVWGLTTDPAGSLAVGTIEATPVLMLPGFPTDCLVGAVQFLRPAIAWIGSWSPSPLPTVQATLDGKLRSEPGTRTVAGVTLSRSGPSNEYIASPHVTGETRRLSAMAAIDGWVVIEAHEEGIPAETVVSVQLFDWSGTQW